MIQIFLIVIIIPLFIVINHLDSNSQFVYGNSDKIFVYISNGGDGNITVMKLNPETGYMKLVEK